eukprot:scaffold6052_cov118-Cylindrotheca_fusiformis.AAC.24
MDQQQSKSERAKVIESLMASVESPPPTPRGDFVTERRAAERRGGGDSTPPAKRLKHDGEGPAEEASAEGGPQHRALPRGARTPATPRIDSESGKGSLLSEPFGGSGLETPVSVVSRRSSASPSDLSSSSRGGKDRTMSPAPYIQHDIPPAPPSTPASDANSLNAITRSPLPYAAVQNADILVRQQLLADGSATPAPPKSKKPPKQQKQPSLVDDFSDWAVGERYRLQRMLGRGSYGEVAQAVDLHQSRPDAYVAIKRIPSPFDQEVDAVRLFREIHILRRLRGHECIIQLLDVVQPPTDDLNDFHDLYLVTEYVDTDLYKLIMSPQYLTTEHIQTFLYQMLAGLKFLHSASVIHRDLKPANILLNEDCSLKICDFGLARIVDSKSMSSGVRGDGKQGDDKAPPSLSDIKRAPLTRQLTKHVVTRWYRAPELILIQPYTSAVDIWSLGCIMAELLSMQEGNVPGYQDRTPLFPGGTCYPLSGETNSLSDERLDQLNVIFGIIGTPTKEEIDALGTANAYIKTLEKKKPKKLEELYPASDPVALDLLKQMLLFDPKARCTAEEALEHDFFKGVRRKELESVAGKELIAPDFLDSLDIDLESLKQSTYEEVLWYRDNGEDPKNPVPSRN